jgi:hypothetical protein
MSAEGKCTVCLYLWAGYAIAVYEKRCGKEESPDYQQSAVQCTRTIMKQNDEISLYFVMFIQTF